MSSFGASSHSFSSRRSESAVTTISSLLAAAGSVLPIINSGSFTYKRNLGRGTSFHVDCNTFIEDSNSGQERLVAVKRLRKEAMSNRANRENVRGELQILTHPPLAKHQNIIDLLGYGWIGECSRIDYEHGMTKVLLLLYFVLELADYESLRDFCKSLPPAEISEEWSHLASLGLDVASGILALHQSNIIHGDVKADNVLVCSSQVLSYTTTYIAKLSDFESALLENECIWRDYLGTPIYNLVMVEGEDDEDKES